MKRNYETTRRIARIIEIEKEELKECSSRIIRAKLKAEMSNEIFSVRWAQTPSIICITGNWSSKAPGAFEWAWKEAKEGDIVMLVHTDNDSYFRAL